jgi:predicted MFS family arabinose efflux permease
MGRVCAPRLVRVPAASPGLVIGHLRDELDLSYSTGGLHVAAFAAGAMVAGVTSARLERALGRRALLWSAAALMGGGDRVDRGAHRRGDRRVAVGHGRRRRAAARRAVAMTSFAVLLAPLTVGTLADATSLTAALGVVPVLVVLAAAALTLVGRARPRASGAH